MKRRARQKSNFYPSVSKNRHSSTELMLSCMLSQHFLIPLCLKEFSQFAQDESQRRRKRKKQTKRRSDRGRDRSLPWFTSHWHPEASPEAFSKKTSSCDMDQTEAAATSRPTKLWYFSCYQHLFCTLLCKWIFSFGLAFLESSLISIPLFVPDFPFPPSWLSANLTFQVLLSARGKLCVITASLLGRGGNTGF